MMRIKKELMLCGILVFVACSGTAIEKTMTIARCQALDAKGRQCSAAAEEGAKYCWRHRGFPKAVRGAMNKTGETMENAWTGTRAASTNAWNATKSGAQKAWNAIEDAADDARVNFIEMMGGKDAQKKGEGK